MYGLLNGQIYTTPSGTGDTFAYDAGPAELFQAYTQVTEHMGSPVGKNTLSFNHRVLTNSIVIGFEFGLDDRGEVPMTLTVRESNLSGGVAYARTGICKDGKFDLTTEDEGYRPIIIIQGQTINITIEFEGTISGSTYAGELKPVMSVKRNPYIVSYLIGKKVGTKDQRINSTPKEGWIWAQTDNKPGLFQFLSGTLERLSGDIADTARKIESLEGAEKLDVASLKNLDQISSGGYVGAIVFNNNLAQFANATKLSYWKANTAGSIGGLTFNIGDKLICKATITGTPSTWVGSPNWAVEANTNAIASTSLAGMVKPEKGLSITANCTNNTPNFPIWVEPVTFAITPR